MVAVATILVVDDEPRIVQLVRDYLEHGGFTVLTASDGPAALRTARTGRPDLVVLDLGLPGLDGLDVARSLRRDGQLPIIMLTARTEESDKLVGLELGADDYLTKPFSPKELVARVRAVLRGASDPATPSDVIRVGSDVELDMPRMEARFGGRRVDLTKSEFQIVSLMARQPGRVFTRAQLLDAVHGVAVESYERAIDAHVKNLRRSWSRIPVLRATCSPSSASATSSPRRERAPTLVAGGRGPAGARAPALGPPPARLVLRPHPRFCTPALGPVGRDHGLAGGAGGPRRATLHPGAAHPAGGGVRLRAAADAAGHRRLRRPAQAGRGQRPAPALVPG